MDKVSEFTKKYYLLPEGVAILIDIFLRRKARKHLHIYSRKIFVESKEIVELYQLKEVAK